MRLEFIRVSSFSGSKLVMGFMESFYTFKRNRSTTLQILTIRRILEGVRAKNMEATILFVDFSKPFDSVHRGKME